MTSLRIIGENSKLGDACGTKEKSSQTWAQNTSGKIVCSR